MKYRSHRRTLERPNKALATVLLVGCFVGCAKEEKARPVLPRTVFEHSLGVAPDELGRLEREYPPYDRTVGAEKTPWIGVSVLRDGVRYSRPASWHITDGTAEPGRAYIRYVTPDAYSFAIYERTDAPDDLWRDIQRRFESDVAAVGARVVGMHVPMASFFNQGRAYTVERALPVASRCREVLLRSEHRIVLVQMVSQDSDLSQKGNELLEVLKHMEVL
jgi:hypothetical protein